MTRSRLDQASQSSCIATKTLWTDTERVDSRKQIGLKLSVKRLAMFFADIPA
jgi:hypothetical protein